MDQFHYTDIFATKGVEYLLIIAYLVLFVLFTRWLQPQPRRSEPVTTASGPRRKP